MIIDAALIINIALGVVFAIIIMAFLPYILGYGLLLAITALGIGIIVWIFTDTGAQVWVVAMLILGVLVVVKDRTEKYWKPTLGGIEAKLRLNVSAIIQAALCGAIGVSLLVLGFSYYPEHFGSAVVLLTVGPLSIAFAAVLLWQSRMSFNKFPIRNRG